MAIDVTDSTFQTAVLDRSQQVPVVVDLWAEWCGPCKQLGPTLEKVIDETNGAVVLAKVDVDANPGTARAFQVQSIPAVYAVSQGKVIDGFVGAQPENMVREFVAKLAPAASEVDQLVAAGDEPSLRKALELEPGHVEATVSLAEILLDRGDKEEALQLLAKVPDSPDVRMLAARARMGDDVTIDIDGRLSELLDSVKEDEAARREFVDLLDLMGPEDPRTPAWRKKLTARLY